jgi:hypothetical protein
MSSRCTLQKRSRKRKLTYTGATGTPAVGQTVTGVSSGCTAVISRLGTGYLVVSAVTGTFTTGETIATPTLTATLSAQTDYENQSGEFEYYWADDQTLVPCRFGYSGSDKKGVIIHETGQLLDLPVKVALPDTITLTGNQDEWATEYRISTDAPGFAGTYQILSPYVINGISGIDHYSFILKAVQ